MEQVITEVVWESVKIKYANLRYASGSGFFPVASCKAHHAFFSDRAGTLVAQGSQAFIKRYREKSSVFAIHLTINQFEL